MISLNSNKRLVYFTARHRVYSQGQNENLNTIQIHFVLQRVKTIPSAASSVPHNDLASWLKGPSPEYS